MTTGEPASATQRKGSPRSELCVVVACHTFACAIPVRYVERLALDEDVKAVPGRSAVVESNGERFAAANLGTLLGTPQLGQAWVLLRVPVANGVVPIALRTGPCLMVRQVAIEAPLLPGLFERRGAAVLGAFTAGTQRGFAEQIAYGLVLALHQLWEPRELEHLRKLVSSEGRGND